MTLSDLKAKILAHSPGSLIPRDWLALQLEDVEGVATEQGTNPIADLTVEEAGKVLGRSPSTVREYARDGLLPGSYRQRGREWRIPHTAIAAFQAAESARPKPGGMAEGKMPSGRTLPASAVDLGAWRKERAS